MNGFTCIVLAFIVESVWETIKGIIVKGKVSIDRVGSITVALIITFAANADITRIVGIEMKYGIGKILTAILISRGSNFTHDFMSLVSTEYQSRK